MLGRSARGSWGFGGPVQPRTESGLPGSQANPESFPAAVYAETVLGPNFEDARKYYLDALLQIHYAHTRMLARQGILSAQEEGGLLDALRSLRREEIAAASYDGASEDLFFFVEKRLEERCGPLAGKMHTARSRNDIGIALYRMALRGELLKLASAEARVRAVVLDKAAGNLETVMPAHTPSRRSPPRWRTTCLRPPSFWRAMPRASRPALRA